MNNAQGIGMVVGLMVGLILAVCLLKFANKNHKAKTNYDERQELIRGTAYRYAFYAVVICEAVLALLDIFGVTIPLNTFLTHFSVIVIGGIVLAGYSIWKGVYWGLNNDKKRYIAIIVIATFINALPVAGAIRNGEMIVDGQFDLAWLNVMVLIMMAAIGIVAVVKMLVDKNQSEED